MPARSPLTTSIERALDSFLANAKSGLAALADPYRARARRDAHAALGAPVAMPLTQVRSPLGHLADAIAARGGDASALVAVEQQDQVLDQLVADFRAGRFDINTASSWVADVERFAAQVEVTVLAARAAVPAWGALADGHAPRSRDGDERPQVLTPELAVSIMGGSISVAGLRARIRKGEAGPWRRVGGKWQIPTAAFLGWHAQQPDQQQALARTRGEVLEKLATRHPGRRRSRAHAVRLEIAAPPPAPRRE